MQLVRADVDIGFDVRGKAKTEMNRLLRVLSMIFAALPFAFGSIRAVQTGNDLRYLWVALAALCGAAVALRVGGGAGTASNRGTARSMRVFTASTLLAVLMGMLLGTSLGPGLLVVASAFGFCFAVATLPYVMGR